ncbi:unnamed protein product [Rotaria sp. Silwood1]|nr:unnamed protein product [Rotaria sp. Silwood1]CAF3457247.1 unnamed protein product [Rotaria sp. Silwood1]CAF3474286.1 unnamed protein product [Rotaria sp. Silwood1]
MTKSEGQSICNREVKFNPSRSTFNNELYELWQCNQTSEFIQKIKYKLVNSLQELFRDIFPYAGLYIIGSTLSEYESSYILQKICDIFQHGEYFRHVKLVKKTFPILRFFDLLTSMTCNIYLNEAVTIRNTYLMRFYSECDHRLPILINIIKYWASKYNLKQRIHYSFNGYCLTLMCIYYLQIAILPSPIVPRFNEIISINKFDKNIDIRKLNLFDTIDLAKIWISINVNVEVDDLFIGFLKFYAIDFDFPNNVISIRTGRKMNKRELINEIDRNNRYVVIEEPLIGTNVASGISTDKIYQELIEIFRTTYNKISSTHRLISL